MIDRIPDPYAGEGPAEAAAADLEDDELEGTKGSSGGGPIEGEGQVSGGTTDRERSMPAGTAHGIAAEAEALGHPEQRLAGAGQRSNAGVDPTGAETVGVVADRPDPGSGTAKDSGDLGGGGGGSGPAGTSGPDRR